MSPSDPVVVYVTCDSAPDAEKMAEALVQEKLAACINVLAPVTSVYTWEGALQKDSESLLMIKTHQDKVSALEKRVKSLHPYTVPEFIVLPILSGSKDYLHWMTQSLSDI